ncbi:ATP-binding protein [Holdemania filiformis]|uniref:ATP-binding protein n=2 Tax=Holdemania filiformis TaxID=61171 RepID=UPI002674DB32|nr:ATP-binding protein [Holdemania filiformis]
MKLIERTFYLEQLKSVLNTPDIKVITGVRRSGKSKLLVSFIDWINKNQDNANIVYINMQETENEPLLEYHALHQYILNHYDASKDNYLFIDEVQLCDQFEKAVNSIHTKEIFDIYVTGSNAFLLSSDLATLFTGRTFIVEIYPFSFKEFLLYFDRTDYDQAFNDYLKIGGFSGSYLYKNLDQKYNYLQKDVYETIVTRDIVTKYKIRNKGLFENLTHYLIDNISNLSSARNIVNYLASSKNKASHNTVINYIKYLCNAFVFYDVKRFDLKGKKYLSTEQKYYLVDHAIKYAILGTKNQDLGRMMENIVYMELKRRGYEIYIGKLYKKEIDFVAIKRNEQTYIQVTTFLDNENTLKRELDPLLNIKDGYPKMIIARSHQEEYSIEGIKIIDIAEWLLK